MEYFKDLGVIALIIGGTTGGVALILRTLLDAFARHLQRLEEALVANTKAIADKIDDHTKEDERRFTEINQLLGDIHGNLYQRHR